MAMVARPMRALSRYQESAHHRIVTPQMSQ